MQSVYNRSTRIISRFDESSRKSEAMSYKTKYEDIYAVVPATPDTVGLTDIVNLLMNSYVMEEPVIKAFYLSCRNGASKASFARCLRYRLWKMLEEDVCFGALHLATGKLVGFCSILIAKIEKNVGGPENAQFQRYVDFFAQVYNVIPCCVEGHGNEVMRLGVLAVQRTHRGRQLGKRLMREAIQKVLSKKRVTIHASFTSPHAREFGNGMDFDGGYDMPVEDMTTIEDCKEFKTYPEVPPSTVVYIREYEGDDSRVKKRKFAEICGDDTTVAKRFRRWGNCFVDRNFEVCP